MDHAETAHGLYSEVVELVGIGATANPTDGREAIDTTTGGVGFDKSLVAGFLSALGDFVERLIPADLFPFGAAGPAHLRLQQPARVQNILCQRRSLGTQRAAVGRVVGV